MSRNAFQRLVSGLMPEKVVDGFEMIHIGHNDGEGRFVTGGPSDLMVQDLHESLMIVELSHAVEADLLTELVQAVGLAMDLVQQFARQIGQLESGRIDYFDIFFLIDLQVEDRKNAFYTCGDLLGDVAFVDDGVEPVSPNIFFDFRIAAVEIGAFEQIDVQ